MDILRARDFLLPNGERLSSATPEMISEARKALWSDVVASATPEKRVCSSRRVAIKRYGDFHASLAILRIWGAEFNIPGFEACDG